MCLDMIKTTSESTFYNSKIITMPEFQRVQIDLRVLLELDEYFIEETSVGLAKPIDWWYFNPVCYITDVTEEQVNQLVGELNLAFAYHRILNKWIWLDYESTGSDWPHQ